MQLKSLSSIIFIVSFKFLNILLFPGSHAPVLTITLTKKITVPYSHKSHMFLNLVPQYLLTCFVQLPSTQSLHTSKAI